MCARCFQHESHKKEGVLGGGDMLESSIKVSIFDVQIYCNKGVM